MSTEVQIPVMGYSVDADWYEGSGNEVLLVLIGFESNKAKYSKLATAINEQTGSGVLVLEYSGHGDSPFELGEIRPAGHFLEVISAYDWLVDNNPGKRINVTGASYGGFQATQLTKYRSFDRLILRVPAIYPPDVFYDKLRTFEGNNHFHDYRHNTSKLEEHPLLKRAKDFSGQVLVIAHELDDICPPNTTEAFVKAFNAQYWVVPGLKHGFGESEITEDKEQKYYSRMAEWLKK